MSPASRLPVPLTPLPPFSATVANVTGGSPDSSPDGSDNSDDSSAAVGAIAGGTVGGVAVLVAIVIGLVCLRRKRRSKAHRRTSIDGSGEERKVNFEEANIDATTLPIPYHHNLASPINTTHPESELDMLGAPYTPSNTGGRSVASGSNAVSLGRRNSTEKQPDTAQAGLHLHSDNGRGTLSREFSVAAPGSASNSRPLPTVPAPTHAVDVSRVTNDTLPPLYEAVVSDMRPAPTQ